MTTTAVIGLGVIGAGVTQDLAAHGHEVIALDLSESLLEKARSSIRQGVRMQRLLSNQKSGPSPEEVLERVTFSTDPETLGDVDFVIENVPEKWDAKQEVYRRIDKICRPDTVFGVNTSSMSITRIASLTSRPDRVVGMHYMNPVPLKPMVEVIRGEKTSEQTLDRVQSLLASCGKQCVVVGDQPGFVTNRVLMLAVNEAIRVVEDGVSSAEDVDLLFKTCFGHTMGPLETADLIGLDSVLHTLEALREAYDDAKFRPAPLLEQMVLAGQLGRKSGQGFHSYEDVGS